MTSMKELIAQQQRYNDRINGVAPKPAEVVITPAIRKKAGRPRTKLPTSEPTGGFKP